METYSIINDFNNISPNITQLHQEIVDSSITETLIGVSSYEDVVNIQFASALSVPEKNILNGLVSSHVPVYTPLLPNTISLIPRQNEITSSSYKRILTTTLPATTYATAKAICRMDDTLTSYDIRIVDHDNKTVLLTKNLTNVNESTQELGVFSNLSSASTQVDISVKKNGGNANSKIYIESFDINFA
jgi:hypothetical protein